MPGGWAISKRLPNSLPIYFLGDRCATLPYRVPFTYDLVYSDIRDIYDARVYCFFEGQMDKGCALDHEFPADSSPEVLAAEWDSPERILGHAFRAFLFATHPRTGNCLVDTNSRLWLIDHEKIVYRESAEDIRELFELVQHSSHVMAACQLVGDLTEEHIEQALSGITERFRDAGHYIGSEPHRRSRFSNPADAASYFTERLRTWREYFGVARRPSTGDAVADSLSVCALNSRVVRIGV